MFGQPDYLIRVAVADPVAYEALYMNELAPITGVGRVNSQFTMKLVKSPADVHGLSRRRTTTGRPQ